MLSSQVEIGALIVLKLRLLESARSIRNIVGNSFIAVIFLIFFRCIRGDATNCGLIDVGIILFFESKAIAVMWCLSCVRFLVL
jgi:hypothetical protein